MGHLSLAAITVLALFASAECLRRVCYYTNWAQYRNGPAKFYPENVDPNLCTHVIYAFAKLQGNKLVAFEWNDESTAWMKGMYERFDAIKQQNPSVKTMLAVGGWNMGSAPFTAMSRTAASRHEFATTSIDFLRKHNFDGLDLDWEYPANRGSPPEDRHKFTELIQELRTVFGQESVPAGKSPLLISAAVGAGKEKIDTAYEVAQISNLLDMINLMTYDLHGSWESFTGHHSPLYARSNEVGNQTTLNVDWAAQYWVSKGADPAKMNIGMPLYGRSFKLPWGHSSETIGCAANGAGAAGRYTSEAGFMSYYEVCEKLKQGATKYYEQEQKVPYFVSSDLWVGYDDTDSIKLKVDYVKQNNFGGVMVWSLDLDDFSGICGQGKYPLMHAIIQELGASGPAPGQTNPPVTQPPMTTTQRATTTTQFQWWTPAPQKTTTRAPWQPPTTTQAPWQPPTTTRAPWQPQTTQAPTAAPAMTTTTVPQPATTRATKATTTATATDAPVNNGHHHDLTYVSNSEFDCSRQQDGYYASPSSCSMYYVCAAGMTFRTDCHPGLLFNENTLYCDFPDHVTCHANGGQPQQPLVTQGHATNPPMTHAPIIQPTTTRAPITQRPYTQAPYMQAPTTQAPINNGGNQNPANFCKGKMDGFYKDPTDCSYFYQCSFEIAYHEPCPSGTYFSTQLQGCDWAANVPTCP